MEWWRCLLCFLCGAAFTAVVIYAPRWMVDGHRWTLRILWRWKSRPRGGRPRISSEVIDLIHQMCREPKHVCIQLHSFRRLMDQLSAVGKIASCQ
jgi:hypothetical protein